MNIDQIFNKYIQLQKQKKTEGNLGYPDVHTKFKDLLYIPSQILCLDR